MAKTWRLTLQAEASLVEIANWTVQVFGPNQAKAYELDLIAFCQDLADGRAHTRSCRDHLSAGVGPDLRFARFGSHLVIFVELGSEVVITDFLHARRDLPKLLAEQYLDDPATLGYPQPAPGPPQNHRARRASNTNPSAANTMFPSQAPSHTGSCPVWANSKPNV